MAIYGIPELTAFELLDLTTDATLLAISCILQSSYSTGEMAELMADIITDIRADGRLDDTTLNLKLVDNAISISLSDIRDNMTLKYAELGINKDIPDFESVVKSFIVNNTDPDARITYPATGLYGVNILSDEVTSVTKLTFEGENIYPIYSMNADVPRGLSLRIVLKNGPYADSNGSWYLFSYSDPFNWQISQYDSELQLQEFAVKGKQGDMRLGFITERFGGINDSMYVTIEYYENGSVTPTKVKKLYLEDPESRI